MISPMNQLTYDILTVQPMAIYEDDVEYVRKKNPDLILSVKQNPFIEMLRRTLPEGAPKPPSDCVVVEVQPEKSIEFNQLVVEHRKIKYAYLLEE